MRRTNHSLRLLRLLAALFYSMLVVGSADAAVLVYNLVASGGGEQDTYLTSNAISGTATASVPRFDGSLGTLVQADFEWAATIAGSWTSDTSSSGTSTLDVAGPSDVGGQPMGDLTLGFVGPYFPTTPSNDFDADLTNVTYTSGAFFDSLTGSGAVLMSWDYSGESTLDTPATGEFNWGGSVHAVYTYEAAAIPEPGALVLALLGLLALGSFGWRRSTRA